MLHPSHYISITLHLYLEGNPGSFLFGFLGLVHRLGVLESSMSNLNQNNAAEEGHEARGEQISSLNQQQVASGVKQLVFK
jgi:hypothetical protein